MIFLIGLAFSLRLVAILTANLLAISRVRLGEGVLTFICYILKQL